MFIGSYGKGLTNEQYASICELTGRYKSLYLYKVYICIWGLALKVPLSNSLFGFIIHKILGRSIIAPEIFNCSAPDTGFIHIY